MPPNDVRLRTLRTQIDRIDAGIVALAALRRRMVRRIAARKAPGSDRDRMREAQVQAHAAQVATDLGLPRTTASRLVDALIFDACDQQGYAIEVPIDATSVPGTAMPPMLLIRLAHLLPPPRTLSPLLRRVPQRWHAHLLQRAMQHALADPIRSGELDFLSTRTIGIEATDLGLAWSVGLRDGALQVVDDAAEASVKGTVTDLMLLASRAEDADTLFFQRRLVLTGDTELGLLARNTLDRLDWERIPLGMRIALHRAARFARDARDAWCDAQTAGTASQPGPPSQ